MNLRTQGLLPPTSADAYLIWPRGGNTGDRLIADACERFLRDRGIDVWRSDGSLEEAAAGGDKDYLAAVLSPFRGMLMFPGGGNIGIYPDNEAIRAGILAQATPRQRCLVFSQSAVRAEPALIDSRVTVWCRDAVSLAILEMAGTRVELVPDMAFYMDDLIAKRPGGEGVYFIRREPGRDRESVRHNFTMDCPAADLTFDTPLEQVIATLDPYDTVLTDRLHGGLIALMMRKKVVFLPIAYHKMRAFIETWLSSCPAATYVDTPAELPCRIAALQPASCDLHRMFCQFADPAFDRFLLDR
jgi:exopolysaccharide biosynthesis predicted pyruvyltransferase EpsI